MFSSHGKNSFVFVHFLVVVGILLSNPQVLVLGRSVSPHGGGGNALPFGSPAVQYRSATPRGSPAVQYRSATPRGSPAVQNRSLTPSARSPAGAVHYGSVMPPVPYSGEPRGLSGAFTARGPGMNNMRASMPVFPRGGAASVSFPVGPPPELYRSGSPHPSPTLSQHRAVFPSPAAANRTNVSPSPAANRLHVYPTGAASVSVPPGFVSMGASSSAYQQRPAGLREPSPVPGVARYASAVFPTREDSSQVVQHFAASAATALRPRSTTPRRIVRMETAPPVAWSPPADPRRSPVLDARGSNLLIGANVVAGSNPNNVSGVTEGPPMRRPLPGETTGAAPRARLPERARASSVQVPVMQTTSEAHDPSAGSSNDHERRVQRADARDDRLPAPVDYRDWMSTASEEESEPDIPGGEAEPEFPTSFCCPITQVPMQEAACAEDEHSYERSALVAWAKAKAGAFHYPVYQHPPTTPGVVNAFRNRFYDTACEEWMTQAKAKAHAERTVRLTVRAWSHGTGLINITTPQKSFISFTDFPK